MSGLIGLLPWDRLPVFILGGIFMIIGFTLLMYSSDPLFSLNWLKDASILFVGLIMIIYSIVKKYKKHIKGTIEIK